MAKKRYRDFLRISMTAKTALFLEEKLVDKTFNDHYSKCHEDDLCCHKTSQSLPIARLLESGLKVGVKRATLDLPCPFSAESPQRCRLLYLTAAARILSFAVMEKKQLQQACKRICQEIADYADRNAMQVIAEAAL